MKKTRRVATRAITLGVAVLALIASVPAASSARSVSAAKPVTGGTWTIGIANEIPTLDPVRNQVGSLTQGGDRMFLVFGTLMKLNSKTGAIMPGLAESVTTTDAQTWTLKLRPNVKFSDGTPLDADAVIFNFDRFIDPANAFNSRSTVTQIAKINKIDALTVEFKLAQPNGSFGVVFTDTVGEMGSPTAIKADPRNWGQKPVGAGAYLLKEWVRDQKYTFVRNPDYFDKPRPYIDTIIFKVLPQQSVLASALKAGEIDAIHVADSQNHLPVATADPKTFKAFDPAKVSGTVGMACNLDKAPCNDVRYREALSLSFDFKAGKDIHLPGTPYKPDVLQCAPWGPGSPYCAKDVVVKYNPTRAKKLFDEVRADGISTDLVYTWLSASGAVHGEYVQQQLAKVGVKVELRLVSTNEYITITNTHAFQAATVVNPPSVDMATRFYNDWHSVGGPNGGRDVANLNNAALDVALEKGRNSIKLEDKIAGFQEAQRVIAKNFLVMWLYPQIIGIVYKHTLQLPNYVSPNAPIFRYEEAWIKADKK